MGDVINFDPNPLRLRVVEPGEWPEPAFSNEHRLVSDNLRPVVPPARPWGPTLPDFDDPKEPA